MQSLKKIAYIGIIIAAVFAITAGSYNPQVKLLKIWTSFIHEFN
jgi:hypothetical protein